MTTVNGTANNDTLFIGSGRSNDILLGLAGNDYLDALAGAGNNILRGGEGDDELYAYSNDQLFGEAGNDTLSSDGSGNNTLDGGDGNDTIYADRNDLVSGGAGNDTIFGGQGGNTLTGGTGKDVFWIANVDVPTNPNTVTDFNPLEDTVRVNLAGVTNLSNLTFAKSGNDATISFGGKQLALVKNTILEGLNSTNVAVNSNTPNNVGTINRNILATDPANLTLKIQDFNNKITGDSRNNIIDDISGGGFNQIFAGEGTDELYASVNDQLFGEGGNDILDASQGKGGNRLDGGTGNDQLFAGSNDQLFGGDGDDTLYAGKGGNTITGGNGKDTFVLATATLPTSVNTITDFRAGIDTLKIFGIPGGIGDDITKLTAVQQGNDTLLRAGTVDLALLKGIQANSITDVLNPALRPIAGIGSTKNLFITDGSTAGWSVNAVSQKVSNKVNEIGIFAVDDATGKIGGVAPGTAAYLKLVTDSAKPIFSTLANNFFSTSSREIELDPNKTYEFFEVQDGSIYDLQQQIASGKTPTNILFSLPDVTGSSAFKVTPNSANDGYKVSVNNDELVLNVTKLASTTPNIPIGAKSQGLAQGRIIDLSDAIYAGKTLKADITTRSDAAYNDNIAFYVVEDAVLGTIKLANGSTLKPGDANYAVEAVKSAVLLAGKTDTKLNQDIVGGKIYAPVLVAQGTLNDFVTKNPTNGGDGTAIHAYFNYLGANSDNLDHFRLIGNNTFGAEDLFGGGDRDFNDIVIQVKVS